MSNPAGTPPTWLSSPPLPRTFALDLLEALIAHPARDIFSTPAMLVVLQQKVSSLA